MPFGRIIAAFNSKLAIFAGSFALVSAGIADAKDLETHPQIAYLGAHPDQIIAPAEQRDNLVLTLDALPAPEDAEMQVFAALLRSNPVTRLTTSLSASGFSDQLVLVADVTLSGTADAQTVELGGLSLSFDGFNTHVKAVIDAINPNRRAVAFVRITDPEARAPGAISGMRAMADAMGFGLTVVTIVEPGVASCPTPQGQSIPRDLIGGVADREPFGNGDGSSTLEEVEAYVSSALDRHSGRSSECGAMYSFLIDATENRQSALLTHGDQSRLASVESAVYHETFEARFLQKSSAEAELLDYLAACEFCPLEAELNERLDTMRRMAVEVALEGEIWQTIKNDSTPERLSIYLDSCKYCEHKDAAETKIRAISLSDEFGDEELAIWSNAKASRNPDEIRAYLEACRYCGFREEATTLVEEIERDAQFQAEAALFEKATGNGDLVLARSYVADCEYCADKDAAMQWIKGEERRRALLGPCEREAGLPQSGGPRLLEDINISRALNACEAASEEFPDDGLIATYLGRVAQARGNFAAAETLYQKGIKSGIPAAYGLAAYLSYSPKEGIEPNMRRAEELAMVGSEAGDWLSKEVLTVLYAKQLVPGRSPADAYRVARPNAEDGNPIAQYFVGFFHQSGTGVTASPTDAVFWFEKAVAQDYVHAYSYLADHLESGEGITADTERAANLYWQGVEEGDETAITRLTSEIYERDQAVVRSVQERLRSAGFYRGAVDGIAGPSTVNALNAYRESLTSSG